MIIKNLLDEVEIARTKFNKFKVVACIMCVISNSPIFLYKHQSLRNVVLFKS